MSNSLIMGRTIIKKRSGTRSYGKGVRSCKKLGQSVNDWAVGITIAPRDEKYYSKTIDSVMKAGWESPILFTEPNVELCEPHKELKNIKRNERYGAWKNFCSSLQDLVEMYPAADAYFMIQDDVIFCKGVRLFLENNLWPDERTGFVSVFTPSHYTAKPTGFYKRNMGGALWMAQTIIMPPDSARNFLQHPVKTGHNGDRNIDNRLGLWASREKRYPWYFCPSLAQHIGSVSTLWTSGANQAAGRKSASDFVGEDYDVGVGYG